MVCAISIGISVGIDARKDHDQDRLTLAPYSKSVTSSCSI